MGILGPIAEELKQLSDQAGAGPTSLVQQQEELFKGMSEQAQEFHRRYNNVKQRNERSGRMKLRACLL
ncbi:MAG: hypothetical protein ACPIOQ_03900 [Promethearchaeia archaeon]